MLHVQASLLRATLPGKLRSSLLRRQYVPCHTASCLGQCVMALAPCPECSCSCTTDTAIEGGISVPPLGLKSASIGDESLLADLMTYCVEGGKSTIDLAGAKAKFADVEVALLERSAAALTSPMC